MRGHLSAHRYLIALGSNMRVAGIGSPHAVVEAAFADIEASGGTVEAVSNISRTAPIGPSQRRYANAAALVASNLAPEDFLTAMQAVERRFGRRRRGQRWRARPLDLDVILWSGGIHASDSLVIPHPEFRKRAFVLAPAARIAPDWREPVTGLTLRQLSTRLTTPRPLPRARHIKPRGTPTRLGP